MLELFTTGPFDLIVANPSYAFYPHEFIDQYKIRRHEIGADYGTEPVIKIICGFDHYLTENGSAYICVGMPKVHGRDYLIDKVRDNFANTHYRFDFNYVSRNYPDACREYYEKSGISHFYFVIIRINRGKKFAIKKRKGVKYCLKLFW